MELRNVVVDQLQGISLRRHVCLEFADAGRMLTELSLDPTINGSLLLGSILLIFRELIDRLALGLDVLLQLCSGIDRRIHLGVLL